MSHSSSNAANSAVTAPSLTPVSGSSLEGDLDNDLPEALPGRPKLVALLGSGSHQQKLLAEMLCLKPAHPNCGPWKLRCRQVWNEAELLLHRTQEGIDISEIVLVVVAPVLRRPSRQFGWGAKEFESDQDWNRLDLPNWVREMPHVVVINARCKSLDLRSLAGTIRSTFFTEEFDRRRDDDSKEIYGPLATSENPISSLSPTDSYHLRRRAREKYTSLERAASPFQSIRMIFRGLAAQFQREQTSP